MPLRLVKTMCNWPGFKTNACSRIRRTPRANRFVSASIHGRASKPLQNRVRAARRAKPRRNRGGSQLARAIQNVSQTRLLQTTITILVYWHRIVGAGGVGAVSDTQIADSILVLNNAYDPDGYVFNLVQTDETTNDASYNVLPVTNAEPAMKAKAPWRP